MGVFLASYIGVWKRHLYGLVKRVCVFLEAYIGVWKRLYMSVSKRLHMDVSKRLPMGVSKRLHMGVSKRHPQIAFTYKVKKGRSLGVTYHCLQTVF